MTIEDIETALELREELKSLDKASEDLDAMLLGRIKKNNERSFLRLDLGVESSLIIFKVGITDILSIANILRNIIDARKQVIRNKILEL